MPLIECIGAIFPENLGPYSMPEIVGRLQRQYSPHLSRSSIYAAHKALRSTPSLAHVVKPLDEDASELLYSAEGARRIARRAIGNRTPAQITPRMLAAAREKSNVSKMLTVGTSGMKMGFK